ncbi:hypothetical protein HSX37_18560|uniref:Helix-turn-helix domain-containing protein n=1 Tax=Dendrosporobacter quercicolus TaxID=146817 RepID=A0A1H0AB18_9FIRM|nr:hypothetical protein [Dendrosporobacter quercicolus]NSL50019.1 hypothetical protein [Dendrosporobacter quercicolus DSM 1736]SDN29896.1 hypothetical protein SAMN04488502_1173 [Dendrosporobacter quercicolus]
MDVGGTVNYIVELNGFYASLLTRPLSSEAQALWGVLMHLFNRAGWPPRLTVAASTLLGFLGYSYTTLSRARGELVAAGLLIHTPRPGRSAPWYELQSIQRKPVDKSVDNPVDKPRLSLVRFFCQP